LALLSACSACSACVGAIKPGRSDGQELDPHNVDRSDSPGRRTPGSSDSDNGGGNASGNGNGNGGGPSLSPTVPVPEPAELEKVWSPLSVLTVVNPMDFGAAGNGSSDDLNAINSAINALPAAGGVVYFPPGKTFKKTNVLSISKNHVKLWGINRQTEIFQSVAGQKRHQAIVCRGNTGCGVFGFKLRSDANQRFDALEDNQLSADGATMVEIVGNEVQGSSAVGLFLYGSKEHYIEGNYVHHTYADHIHHTNGASASWVWNNYIFNEAPSKGDDGIACVTYGANSTRCNDMEWWHNSILHTGWGRGYSVIGGNNISIHDNWAIGVAGAGVIVASEAGWNTAASKEIGIANNYVYQCGHTISHPGILVSGLSSTSGPLQDIALNDNVSVGTPAGPYRAEGSYQNVTNANLVTASSALPTPMPGTGDVHLTDTSTLRTRDISFVPDDTRAGLYRIHVRRAPGGSGFQERFEYVVKGPADAVSAFTQARSAAGDYVSEQRTISDGTYALILCSAPVSLPSGLSAVPFRELRSKDQAGTLSWLWQRLDTQNY
jgi:hypothetical protein